MAGHAAVRASRDGDQFHYHWAARRCLELLPGGSDLVAVTIEGSSQVEGAGTDEGEELIDVGLYYGAEDRNTARQVRYVQLKHSTYQASYPWTASGLKDTLKGFAQRFQDLIVALPAQIVAERFRFEFTTNRPIQSDLAEALIDLAAGGPARHQQLHAQLIEYSGLDAAAATKFFPLFAAEGGEDGLWTQRNLLSQDVSAYLPDADFDAPVQLKELVTRKATTEFTSDSSIRRHDVLRALKATEDGLTPAPSTIAEPAMELVREQEGDILAALLGATNPLVIHAEGGVGKSVLAARLARSMPAGSIGVLYDCYGNGLYRTSLNARHHHRDALVQIANELAAQGLCHPLIPSSSAGAKAYMRAFLFRLQQAATLIQARAPGASLCLIVDAADNAQMAAEELSEPASFVRDLIRAPMPAGVRLAFTCRTHRQDKLAAPLDAVPIELKPFSLAETAAHLRSAYPAPTDGEVAEFAMLSSDNPRVQALAMSRGLSLHKMLRELGPTPTTVDRVLANLLERAIAKLKDAHGPAEAGRLERLCGALAVMRPLVPIAVLARLSDISESEARSFALDLGRPIFVKADSLHFLDEPAETWFRERFKPDATAMASLLERLRPLTADSSYAAAVLPQLLLQVGGLNELVALALSGEGLPTDPIVRRDVELQRLIFALKACLQQNRALPAAKLALKAAGETAGEQRQTQLIQENTDVAAVLLTPDRLEEIVARRPFRSGWMGSRHAYDAGLLSGREELTPEASSRLRMAMDWFHAWARLSGEQQEDERVSDVDRVELAMALLRLRGPSEAARFLRRWRWRRHALVAGAQLGRRLLDIDRAEYVDAMAAAAGNDVWLVLGLASASRDVGHRLPKEVLSRLVRLLADRRVLLPGSQDLYNRWEIVEAVTSAVEMALLSGTSSVSQASVVLARYLPAEPPQDMTYRYSVDLRTPLLRAYALEAALRGATVKLVDIAPESSRAQLQSGRGYGRDQKTEVFEREISGQLPWFVLAAEVICGRLPEDLGAAIEAARKATALAEDRLYNEAVAPWQVAAVCWFQVLQDAGPISEALRAPFAAWVSDPKTRLWLGTTIDLCRRAARAGGLASLAMTLASQAFEALEKGREEAESRLADYTKLARAILPVSPSEAAAVFDRAVAFASGIGDENLDRWGALLELGRAASDPAKPKPRTAYRLSRAAELTYEYVSRDKHFDWTRTVEDLTDLCPSSAMAILSRWRDRRFGDPGRLLPLLIDRLVEREVLPRTALVALAGVDAQWNRLDDLKAVAGGMTDRAARETALQIAYRYLRVEPHGHEVWAEVAHLGKRLSVDFADVDRLKFVTTPPPEPPKGDEPPEPAPVIERSDPDWGSIFAGVDFTDSDALRDAFDVVRTYDPPYRFKDFFREAVTRVAAGQEPELIRAMTGWPDFETFELRDLLDALPKPLPARPALRAAVREAVLEVCRREPARVYRRGWSAIIPFQRLEEEGVLTDAAVVEATIEGFAAKVDHLDAGDLFRAIDALASQLSPVEADEALNYGLDLLEDLLRPDDADGAWRAALEPPVQALSALAGYIWAGLGSPTVAVRWQHAHAVRCIVELGWTDLLAAILAWAKGESAGAFVDQGLEFYLWHARQWLTIGFARAALTAPHTMVAAASLLRHWTGLRHVLIRELAAQALDRLANAGVIDRAGNVDPVDVNRSDLPEKVFRGWMDPDCGEDEAAEQPASSEEKYHFGIDIGPYWFRPLGQAFGMTEVAIERRARAVVRGRLGWTARDGRDDARLIRKLFRGRETGHSHGTLPRSDDLQAYHGYHAMMMVAADLLETHQVCRDEDDDKSGFEKWLDDYRLARPDGWWLADRRDPRLIVDPPAIGYEQEATWRWEVSRPYLNAQLTTDQGDPVVWGYWHRRQGDQTETVWIRSALVSRATAESLLVALQTADDPLRHFLPNADHGVDLDAEEFRCAGWIHGAGHGGNLEQYDPWSEKLRYPQPAPSEAMTMVLSLKQDCDGRAWRDEAGGVLRGETWTQEVGYGTESEIESGWRVFANGNFLEHLFRVRPDERLLLSVEVSRDGSRYGGDERNFEQYAWPYQLYYLMGPDGVAHPF